MFDVEGTRNDYFETIFARSCEVLMRQKRLVIKFEISNLKFEKSPGVCA